MEPRDPNPDPTLLGNDRPRDPEVAARDDREVRSEVVRDGDLSRERTGDAKVADHIGEAAGGISGALAGAAIGSVGGPVGTIIGGIAGAVGGWWAGSALADAATHWTDEEDEYYRVHYEGSPSRMADRAYEDVRPAYQLGHIARMNPEYSGRRFDDIETDLERGWSDDVRIKHGEWAAVRGYARDAYVRERALGDDTAVTGYAGGLTNDAPTRPTHAADRVAKQLEGSADEESDRSRRP